jgi:transposase InsO family protein
VARLMREEGVCGKAQGRAKPRTTDSGHARPESPASCSTPTGAAQYASHDLRRILTQLGFVPSMSRKASCWANAAAESFFATFKNEEATWTDPSKADAHAGIANCIHGFYNARRRHSARGHLSPDYYARILMAA